MLKKISLLLFFCLVVFGCESKKFETACSQNTKESYIKYIKDYPEGLYTQQAYDNIDIIKFKADCETIKQQLSAGDQLPLFERDLGVFVETSGPLLPKIERWPDELGQKAKIIINAAMNYHAIYEEEARKSRPRPGETLSQRLDKMQLTFDYTQKKDYALKKILEAVSQL